MERPRLRSSLPGPSRLAGHEGILNSPAISKAIGPTSFCSRLWFVDNCNAREAVEGMNQVCAKDGGERVVSGIPPGGVMRKDGRLPLPISIIDPAPAFDVPVARIEYRRCLSLFGGN
jgi:hypothetical protein